VGKRAWTDKLMESLLEEQEVERARKRFAFFKRVFDACRPIPQNENLACCGVTSVGSAKTLSAMAERWPWRFLASDSKTQRSMAKDLAALDLAATKAPQTMRCWRLVDENDYRVWCARQGVSPNEDRAWEEYPGLRFPTQSPETPLGMLDAVDLWEWFTDHHRVDEQLVKRLLHGAEQAWKAWPYLMYSLNSCFPGQEGGRGWLIGWLPGSPVVISSCELVRFEHPQYRLSAPFVHPHDPTVRAALRLVISLGTCSESRFGLLLPGANWAGGGSGTDTAVWYELVVTEEGFHPTMEVCFESVANQVGTAIGKLPLAWRAEALQIGTGWKPGLSTTPP